MPNMGLKKFQAGQSTEQPAGTAWPSAHVRSSERTDRVCTMESPWGKEKRRQMLSVLSVLRNHFAQVKRLYQPIGTVVPISWYSRTNQLVQPYLSIGRMKRWVQKGEDAHTKQGASHCEMRTERISGRRVMGEVKDGEVR